MFASKLVPVPIGQMPVMPGSDCVNISEFSEVSCHSCDCPGTRAVVT